MLRCPGGPCGRDWLQGGSAPRTEQIVLARMAAAASAVHDAPPCAIVVSCLWRAGRTSRWIPSRHDCSPPDRGGYSDMFIFVSSHGASGRCICLTLAWLLALNVLQHHRCSPAAAGAYEEPARAEGPSSPPNCRGDERQGSVRVDPYQRHKRRNAPRQIQWWASYLDNEQPANLAGAEMTGSSQSRV